MRTRLFRALLMFTASLLTIGCFGDDSTGRSVDAVTVASEHEWFQGFETDTSGWSDFGAGTVHREMSGYTNVGGYADGVASAAGDWHARLRTTQSGGCAPPFSSSTSCVGPFSSWGKASTTNPDFPEGGYLTEVDVYLDTTWAASNPDVRFDFVSAINNADGNHLRDFAFNVGTDPGGAAAWIIGSSVNAFRTNSFPSNPCPSPSASPNTCREPAVISSSGWYTLQHVFTDNAGELLVDMSILDAGGGVVASWTIHSGDPMSNVGGDRYGWFANQEVHDLPVDNTRRALLTQPEPTSRDDCAGDGWRDFGFRNQGHCTLFVRTGRDRR